MDTTKRRLVTNFFIAVLSFVVVYCVTHAISLALLTFSVVFAIMHSFMKRLRMKNEFEVAPSELEQFLTFFADELKRDTSPELSFWKALKVYKGPLSQGLNEVYNQMLNGVPFAEAISTVDSKQWHNKCGGILPMISKAVIKNSQEAGNSISQVILRLRENQKLLNEREQIMRALSFRVKVLTIACSASLALIASLLPIFSTFYSASLSQGYPFSPIFEIPWLVAFTLSLTSALSAYYAGLITLNKKPYVYVILSFLTFWFTIVFATSFLALHVVLK